MADWQEQLNTILSDPGAMAQIVSLAQSIGGQPTEAEDKTQKQNAGGVPPEAAPAGFDPELLRRFAPVLRQLDRPESNETALFLQALRPFLSEKRRGKVERAAQLARLVHLGKTFLTTDREADHV